MIEVSEVKTIQEYELLLRFNNGEERRGLFQALGQRISEYHEQCAALGGCDKSN